MTRFTIASFNVKNLIGPDREYYEFQTYTPEEYAWKEDWLANQILSKDADIVGFPGGVRGRGAACGHRRSRPARTGQQRCCAARQKQELSQEGNFFENSVTRRTTMRHWPLPPTSTTQEYPVSADLALRLCRASALTARPR